MIESVSEHFPLCVVVAAEPRRRPPSWEDQGQQPLHSAGHHPGARLPHHQSGHRGGQVSSRVQIFARVHLPRPLV